MKTSVLVLTIIAASFSLLIGIGTGACVQGVGEMNRRVGNLHEANDAQSFSGMLVLAGVVQCAVGGFGGYKAFRTFGTKQSIKWGILPLVGAGLVSISNTCSFFTSGVLFFIAAFLTFLGSRQTSGLQAAAADPQAVPENAGQSLGSRIKAAGQLTAKQAQRTSLATMTLPSAYRALGKHIFKAGAFREEFPANYVQLGNINAELKAIVTQAGDRPTADGIAAKAKGAALAAKDMAQTKTVDMRGKQALATLGEVVFQKHGEQSGPAEVVRPIMDTRMQIVALDDEIASLSGSGSGQFLTPKRLAIAGVVLIVLIGLAIIGNLGKSGHDADANSNSNSSSNSPTGSADVPSIRTDAGTLFSTFKANEISANAKYKDQMLDVQGIVDDVKDQFGTSHVYLANGQQFELGRVDCSFANSNGLGSLSKGQFVTIRGKCTGLMMDVGLDDCQIVKK